MEAFWQNVARVVLGLLSLYFLVRKCYFLAPTRLGWFMMLANVPYETFCRGKRKRWHVDLAAYVGLAVGWTLAVGPWAGAVWALAFGLVWAYSQLMDLAWRNGELTVQDQRHAGRIPLPLPRLIVNVRGPVLERGRVYDLGDWPVGRVETFEFLVLNPADRVHCQFPFRFDLAVSGGGVTVADDPTGDHPGPDPGEIVALPVRLTAERPSGPVTLAYRLTLGSYVQAGTIRVRSVFDPAGVTATDARIDRWKGGARGAWVWRGDTDLFDPATWQSPEGLAPAMDLSRRFRVPHTHLMSARLTFDVAESQAHSRHLGLDRRSDRIPELVEWLKTVCAPTNALDWPIPMDDGRIPFELGNHYWLHYGTHTAAEPGNDWAWGTFPGQGRYAWSEADGDSLAEQRDNALKCAETFERLFGMTPTSWGIPGRGSDANTPRAIEAAGMQVASDSDCQAYVNVFRQPAPHHPRGATHLVELSKKYPGDPLYGNQCAMLKYWTWHARRHGRVMVLMAHTHLRGYEAASCFHLTEELVRDAVDRARGDLYLGSLTAVGLYWERVLCPEHRWVKPAAGPGLGFRVANTGDEPLEAVPVEVRFSNGGRTLALVDISPSTTAEVTWSGVPE